MKRFFAGIFILIFSKNPAQNIDSLWRQAVTLPSDTERVDLFYAEGFANRSIDPLYAFDCARLAEKFGRSSGEDRKLAKAFNLLGILHYRKGDLFNALKFHKQALELRIRSGDKSGMAKSYTNLGNVYNDLRRFELAENAYEGALKMNYELGDQKQVGNCLLNLGTLYSEFGKSTKDSGLLARALICFADVVENANRRNDYELKALCLNNLAVVNIRMGKYEAAIANCENSMKVHDMMLNEYDKADPLINLAMTYFRMGQAGNGWIYARQAEDLIRRFNNRGAEINLLKLKADQLNQEGKSAEAFTLLKQHMHLKDSMATLAEKFEIEKGYAEETETLERGKFSFPYFYLNLLLISAVACIIFIWRNRS